MYFSIYFQLVHKNIKVTHIMLFRHTYMHCICIFKLDHTPLSSSIYCFPMENLPKFFLLGTNHVNFFISLLYCAEMHRNCLLLYNCIFVLIVNLLHPSHFPQTLKTTTSLPNPKRHLFRY